MDEVNNHHQLPMNRQSDLEEDRAFLEELVLFESLGRYTAQVHKDPNAAAMHAQFADECLLMRLAMEDVHREAE